MTGSPIAASTAIMPSYAGHLSPEELAAVVAELGRRALASGAPQSPTSAPVAVVEDPVCHMQVRAEASAPHVLHQGQDVYFCSQICKDAFARAPSRYPRQRK